MAAPQFTIALPVRNGGSYLKLCVESILAQRGGDFELAILDNASTDGTPDYLASLRDPRVRLYPAERPLSIEENWARIKTIPKAEFLTTIGHDDLLDPGFLDVIARLIRAHPDAGLYYTHYRLLDAAGATLRPCRPMPGRETAAEFLAVRLCQLRDSFGTGHVFRSADYDAMGGIPPFPKLLYADDALFMRLIGSSYRATALEEAFSYRLHGASVSGQVQLTDTFPSLERYAHWLADRQQGDPAIQTVLRRHFADYAFLVGSLRLQQERVDAYRARRPINPEVRPRAEALATMFGGVSQSLPPDDFQAWLLEKAALSFFHRTLLRGWSAQQRFGLALNQKLTDFLPVALRYRAASPGAVKSATTPSRS